MSMALAMIQVAKRARKKQAKPFPMVITHTGEFGTGVFKATDWMAERARRRLLGAAPKDGRPAVKHVAEFRETAKRGLVAANARGFARVLSEGGTGHRLNACLAPPNTHVGG